ncbi:MAG: hypothetical protein R3F61_25075 [Myxococcota bacterium]
MRVEGRPLSVLRSPKGDRFRVEGAIGTIDARGRAYAIRWKEPYVTTDENGVATKRHRKRRLAASTLADAVTLLLKMNTAHALGEPFMREVERPIATLEAIVVAYVTMSTDGRPATTARYRASILQRFLDWAGPEATVDSLSPTYLTDYAMFVKREGITQFSRYVGLVEQVWTWAHDRPERFPGVPTPRRVTGRDGDFPHRQNPVAVDTPSWDEVDAMLAALTPEGALAWRERQEGDDFRGHGYRPQWELHRRVALTQRFTGLRVSQILSIEAEDVNLELERLTIRMGREGAKGMRHDRIVPAHPAWIELVRSWEIAAGPLFAREATKGKRVGQLVIPRGCEVAEVFTNAWIRAEVPEVRWGVTRGREKARPTNAIRARWKSTIAGTASYELATMMVGQASRGEHDAYVALGNPEASPYWESMREALGAIPAVGTT